jgi:choline dehydrogenase-like flavoprotein
MKRDNLVVLTHATVSKLNLGWTLWPLGYKKAYGAKIQFPDGSHEDAWTNWWWKGEVILAAGVVRTPQILELSGIGSKKVLKPLGIDVQIELPGVGENYEDQ